MEAMDAPRDAVFEVGPKLLRIPEVVQCGTSVFSVAAESLSTKPRGERWSGALSVAAGVAVVGFVAR